ncbi:MULTISPECIES: glycine cleavage system aminomethyltransferase GcvT [unclassified Mucilaginibacter]|uniref:glycine cleavage system aminomethyltransferase GcvT n=1 Tax=unclassified Mucilaginibacter TaxID=2617802 RepID=UPI002AC8BFD0|nr:MULTISPECIES: glycine cleavage system aminomethyltransferase GcvT [unclassified Mucilaginibacter]MEB0260035.1 glycine cleavage system aminomethyltransferase GcvT [Mucilaginibacter sp. 10I4]MEB0280540.1 glycine cleavage system aminomethyltransferase GcvT [Mucilaginibacter sp. 10B2]MEB0301120.1 glycine cleavage system aminomethyltransferase GcvT [Mucilaginibacter sp. 5C4]WPX22429.1 glycine cleavage system aminomethyltransferase GcvT [Mucilaginibacter sp. 5C4]
MKESVLTPVHQHLGAKMAPFAGFNMPIQYSTGINAEHDAVRNEVGVFDVSHMGEFIITGDQALDLIQRLTTNDASVLAIGQVQYSCITNEKGGIIDDILVYRLAEEKYMLVVNASNIEKDWNWIVEHNNHGAELTNTSEFTSLLSVQGPYAVDTLQKLTSVSLKDIPYYHFKTGMMYGIPDVIISNTGYTGAGGFELYLTKNLSVELWNAIFAAGRNYRISPIGLGARDTLRLEMGYCLYGNDIDDMTTPFEAGLGWITKFSKDFTGWRILQEQKNKGPKLALVGIMMDDKGIPRHGYRIMNSDQEPVGIITSGTQSPSIKTGIGLGYVDINLKQPGTPLLIEIRNQYYKAKVCRLPFLQSKVK